MPVLAIGDFDVFTDKILGKGGWGKVYLGRQRSLNRMVAVKFLNADMTKEADFVARFRREAQCLASIASDHIIQVYGAGEHEGSQWFAMEFVDGATLQKFIEKGRRFEPEEVVVIGLAVAKALQAAWNSPEKIVHRDIKPSNVLIQTGQMPENVPTPYAETHKHGSSVLYTNFRNVKIKVMDFGLAKLKKEDNEKTLPGTVMGTPKYISPEQAQGKTADVRSDIYSLGVVMFQLATGRTPFEGETAISLLSKHIYDEAPSPSSVQPGLPRELDSVVVKCLGKLPEERYQSPEALISDLEAILNNRRPRVAMGEKTSIQTKDVSREGVTLVRRRSKAPAGALALLLLAGAGVAALGIVPPDGTKRGFAGNLKAHWERWTEGGGEAGPMPGPPPGPPPGPDVTAGKNGVAKPEPDPEAARMAERRELDVKLAEAARKINAGDFAAAKSLIEEVSQELPDHPNLATVRKDLEDAEAKERARGEFEKLLADARSAKEPKDAVGPLEKAVDLARKHGLEGLADAEAKLAEATARAGTSERYASLMREAQTESDPEKALEKYLEASKIASPEQLTTITPVLEEKRGQVAAKHVQAGKTHEAERRFVEALEAYTKALLVASANAEALDGKARIEKLLPKDAAYVPAGKFLFGEEKAERELPAFWIQKREVTCDEYAAFLASMKEAGKEVAAPRSWSGGKVPEGAGGLPVRGVPFADASEYARWKGSGWRLPSEEEWEKAARGTDGRLYPWGDEFAAGNANVARYAQAPLPPGSVPGDSSPCGCLDMAGNVMEWTTTDYDAAKPIYKGVKTLKGGRYDSSERAAQAASRAPGSGADGLEAGFRLVWAP